eukprot:TRINITY_DN3162_c0_g1_i2.p1 TRINITY_DN3162_c0_g1~~TRINITY_DN3162_c0_g1_i2.p1  ORF type:complete len:322 (-),score=71.99 TRINITY_DN3162_c0_g1_i2:63-1028(-)
MKTIHAGVVHEYGKAPVYGIYELNEPSDGEVQVRVIAAGLHRLVVSRASGKHYSSHSSLPMIPGVDGVGTLSDGTLVFFIAFDTKTGSFGEYVNVKKEDCIALPPGSDPIKIAALVNPIMSSWFALNCRAHIKKGASVLILGVTGTSGQIAIQVSRSLGAERIIGLGRNQKILDQLLKSGSLDAVISLVDEGTTAKKIAELASNVDIVLDYLWGQPAKITLETIAKTRAIPSHQLEWVQIGNMAGATFEFPAGALRSNNIIFYGSGLGSVSPDEMRKQFSRMVLEIGPGKITHNVETQSLKDIEKVWELNMNADNRIVFTP